MLKPVLFALAALFLFCLPLGYLPFAFSGIQHPVVAITLLLLVTTLCLGSWEIARQQRITLTATTGWLALAALLVLLPSFYRHAEVNAAWWHAGLTLAALMLFSTLQQFSFNHHQRQLLLWLPLLSGWLIALAIILTRWNPSFGAEALLTSLQGSAGTMLMTALALSGYLLARTKAYKRSWVPLHLLLLATPLVTLIALMALGTGWLITPTLVILLLTQPFLYRFCAKRLHGGWNLSLLAGFMLAWWLGILPQGALFSAPLSLETQAVLTQTWHLMGATQFEGVGLGQLLPAQLLFGLSQGQVLPLSEPYPSWIMKNLTEGGVAYWCGIGLLLMITAKRLLDAPNGTRMMLAAVLLPSLMALTLTPFAAVNPVFAVLFIVLLYWIDNLTARYQRVAFSYSRTLKLTSYSALALAVVTTFSSIYLGEQALRTYQIHDTKLAQYQMHPWWQSFYQDEMGKRAFFSSVERKDSQAQNAYLKAQTRLLARAPSADKYQTLIDLAMLTGNRAIARQISEEAALLFPQRQFEPVFLLQP